MATKWIRVEASKIAKSNLKIINNYETHYINELNSLLLSNFNVTCHKNNGYYSKNYKLDLIDLFKNQEDFELLFSFTYNNLLNILFPLIDDLYDTYYGYITDKSDKFGIYYKNEFIRLMPNIKIMNIKKLNSNISINYTNDPFYVNDTNYERIFNFEILPNLESNIINCNKILNLNDKIINVLKNNIKYMKEYLNTFKDFAYKKRNDMLLETKLLNSLQAKYNIATDF